MLTEMPVRSFASCLEKGFFSSVVSRRDMGTSGDNQCGRAARQCRLCIFAEVSAYRSRPGASDGTS